MAQAQVVMLWMKQWKTGGFPHAHSLLGVSCPIHTMSCTYLIFLCSDFLLQMCINLSLSCNISLHPCSYLQNDLSCADIMLLPKGKLDLKLSLENMCSNLGLSIAVFQRAGRMEIFKPERVVRAHSTTFGTLRSTIFHSAISSSNSRTANTTLAISHVFQCQRKMWERMWKMSPKLDPKLRKRLCLSVWTIDLETASQLQLEHKWFLAVVRYSKPGCFASKRSQVPWWWMSCKQTLKVTSMLSGFELNREGWKTETNTVVFSG